MDTSSPVKDSTGSTLPHWLGGAGRTNDLCTSLTFIKLLIVVTPGVLTTLVIDLGRTSRTPNCSRSCAISTSFACSRSSSHNICSQHNHQNLLCFSFQPLQMPLRSQPHFQSLNISNSFIVSVAIHISHYRFSITALHSWIVWRRHGVGAQYPTYRVGHFTPNNAHSCESSPGTWNQIYFLDDAPSLTNYRTDSSLSHGTACKPNSSYTNFVNLPWFLSTLHWSTNVMMPWWIATWTNWCIWNLRVVLPWLAIYSQPMREAPLSKN